MSPTTPFAAPEDSTYVMGRPKLAVRRFMLRTSRPVDGAQYRPSYAPAPTLAGARLLGNRLTGLLEHIAEDAALVTEVG